MSILKSALSAGRGRIVLIYANADERSVIFASALRELRAATPGRFVLTHWLDALHGPPDVASLRELARPYSSYEAFICGPDPYMTAVKQALAELGVPTPRVHLERFLSLAENPFEATADVGGVAATLEVELDDEKHKLDWPPGQRMLDAMIDAGLDAPYSCREGVCGACACRLTRRRSRNGTQRGPGSRRPSRRLHPRLPVSSPNRPRKRRLQLAVTCAVRCGFSMAGVVGLPRWLT